MNENAPAIRRPATARLVLEPVDMADLDDLYALHADPAVWTHLPSGRHTSPQRTAEEITAFMADWERDGIGYWTARLPQTGQLAGIGGVRLKQGRVFNLYYRFSPAFQGRGYAGETARAALAAAGRAAPQIPVMAYLLEHNTGSARVAERLGLRRVWRGPDAESPDPTAVRLVYADRELPDDVLAMHA